MDNFDEKEPVVSLIAETQGETYALAYEMGFDIKDFSHYYLSSDFCKYEIDSIYSRFQLEFADIGIDEFLFEMDKKGIEIKKKNEEIYYSPHWIGMMYRYLFYRLKMFSVDLDKTISFEELEKVSVDCESFEIDEAIEYVVNYFKEYK